MISFRGFGLSLHFLLLMLIKDKVINKSSVFGLKEACSFRELTY